MGISNEQSVKGAALLEQASGLSITATDRDAEEVRRLKDENRRLRSQLPQKNCSRCGYNHCKQGKKCPANGQMCSACNKPNHFARVCRTTKKKKSFGQLSRAEESDSSESFGQIVVKRSKQAESPLWSLLKALDTRADQHPLN